MEKKQSETEFKKTRHGNFVSTFNTIEWNLLFALIKLV